MASTAALHVSQSKLGRPQISKEGYSENNQFLQVWRRERGEGRGERGEVSRRGIEERGIEERGIEERGIEERGESVEVRRETRGERAEETGMRGEVGGER